MLFLNFPYKVKKGEAIKTSSFEMDLIVCEKVFKGAIFDMDGTILESMGVWQEITTRFLTNRSLPIIEEDMEAYKDMTLDESMRYIKNKYNLKESPEELNREFNGLVANAYIYEIDAKPGVVEYIKKLKKQGVRIAIATSGYRELCEAAMKRLRMSDLIDAYALSSEVGVNKSNPDVYLLAAERIGVNPKECMVFEDIVLGIEGAKKAGMQTTAVYDEYNAQDTENLKNISDYYIRSWNELL